jgi:hypothetical protein
MADIELFITDERGDSAGKKILLPENREILLPESRDA